MHIETTATTDQDTLFAYTNHAYFNLDESESILNHTLMIPTDHYALLDQYDAFCTVKWAILHAKMAEIETQGVSN